MTDPFRPYDSSAFDGSARKLPVIDDATLAFQRIVTDDHDGTGCAALNRILAERDLLRDVLAEVAEGTRCCEWWRVEAALAHLEAYRKENQR